MRTLALMAVTACLLAACASTGDGSSAEEAAELAAFMAPVPASRPALQTNAALGTEANPIRAVGPQGQRDYLSRLRCADGLAPTFSRIGSLGLSGYGKIMDSYRVQCRGEVEQTLVMDMYHCAQDPRTAPGFQLMDPLGTPMTQDGCPDR